jgi:hypothetical protein
MSASRDSSQKFKFVYSNLYQIYRKGKEAAQEAATAEPVAKGLTTGKILKADDLRTEGPLAAVRVNPYTPAELLGPRLAQRAPVETVLGALAAPAARPSLTTASRAQSDAIDGLRKNLQNLNELHSRLRFMLKELEDLVKE